MEKIQWKNNEAPGISAENLNLMQTNVENAISIVNEAKEDKPIVVTNDNGVAIKYADGIMICYAEKTLEFTKKGTFSGDINRFSVNNIQYPITFIGEKPIVVATINGVTDGFGTLGEVNAKIDKINEVVIFSTKSSSTMTARIHFIAIGKWK